MNKKKIVILIVVAAILCITMIVRVVVINKSKQKTEDNARDYVSELSTMEVSSDGESETEEQESLSPKEVFPNGRFEVDENGEININVPQTVEEQESNIESESEDILVGITNVKDNYNRDEEIATDKEILTNMVSGVDVYMYNQFMTDYVDYIGHDLQIGEIETVINKVVVTYNFDILNTDAVASFEKNTAQEETDGYWLYGPTNKYGSDYRIIYFTNGVPSNSKELYDIMYDTAGVRIGGVSEYIEGDQTITIVNAYGDTVTVDLATATIVTE